MGYCFCAASGDEDDPVLDTIWYLTANGSVRGTKAKELTDELTVYPMTG